MRIFCTQCGTANENTSKFCFSCGSPTVTASADPSQPVINSTAAAQQAVALPSHAMAASTENKKITAEVMKLTGVGGWLLFLVITLMIIGPLIALLGIYNLQSEFEYALKTSRAAQQLYDRAFAGTVFSIAYSCFVGYQLTTASGKALSIAKWYLILTPILFIGQAYLMLSVTGLPASSVDAMTKVFVLEFSRIVLGSVIWYVYLVRSKRVRYTYPDPDTHVRCPDCLKFVFAKSATCPHCQAKLLPQ